MRPIKTRRLRSQSDADSGRANSVSKLKFLPASALLATVLRAGADPFLLPKSAAQAHDQGRLLLEVIAIVVIGKILFALAVGIFVLLHIALTALIIIGVIRKRFWRFGIRFCLVGLALLYSALAFMIHSSHEIATAPIENHVQHMSFAFNPFAHCAET